MDSPDPRGGVPLHEAAELLGVTVELLRKRAQRRTIPAYKVDGRWYVVLDGVPNVQGTGASDPVQDRTGGPGQDESHHAPPVVSSTARSQLEAIRDEWLRPLVDRIGELEREAGQLQERVRGVERERDTFRAERDAALAKAEQLRSAQDAPSAAPAVHHATETTDVALSASRSWWQAWRRWLLGR